MSTFSATIELAPGRDGPFIAVDAVVDTGAYYTYLSGELVDSLFVAPTGRRRFGLADGSIIERPIGDVFIRIAGEVHSTICILGDLETETLLGAVTLEEFSLAADPVNERLLPVEKLPLLLMEEAEKR